MKEKILYLESLRGIGALIVAPFHFEIASWFQTLSHKYFEMPLNSNYRNSKFLKT